MQFVDDLGKLYPVNKTNFPRFLMKWVGKQLTLICDKSPFKSVPPNLDLPSCLVF